MVCSSPFHCPLSQDQRALKTKDFVLNDLLGFCRAHLIAGVQSIQGIKYFYFKFLTLHFAPHGSRKNQGGFSFSLKTFCKDRAFPPPLSSCLRLTFIWAAPALKSLEVECGNVTRHWAGTLKAGFSLANLPRKLHGCIFAPNSLSDGIKSPSSYIALITLSASLTAVFMNGELRHGEYKQMHPNSSKEPMA